MGFLPRLLHENVSFEPLNDAKVPRRDDEEDAPRDVFFPSLQAFPLLLVKLRIEQSSLSPPGAPGI